MGTRILSSGAVLAVTAGLLVLGWPQLFTLEREAPFAQLISFRLAAAVSILIGVTLLGVVAIFAPSVRRLVATLTVVGLVFSLSVTSVQLVRGFARTEPSPMHLADVRLLSWNTLGGAPGAERIARLALDRGVNVVALQETSTETATATAAAMTAAGRPMNVFSLEPQGGEPSSGTALLVSPDVGDYTMDTSAPMLSLFPTVILRPASDADPLLVSAHAAPPVRGAMPLWRSDLDRVSQMCGWGDLVIAGDLNSTLDHLSALSGPSTVGECSDAGLSAGGAAVGTWPASVPSAFAALIDHVLYSGAREVTGYEVVESEDSSGSDHRPVLVQLSVARMGKGFEKR